MTVTDRAKPTVMYDAAERLVRLGVSVIPIQPSTKEPPDGFKWGEYANRIADSSERYEWFVNAGYQLAAVMDVISGGLIVLDFDSPDGYDRMAARYPVITTYPRVKTARGHHVWIRSDERTKKYVVNVDDGNVEIRAGRHYVLVPPSTHPSGEQYVWEVPPWDGIPTVDLKTLGLAYVNPEETEAGTPINTDGKPLRKRDMLHMVEALAPHYVVGQRNPLILALAGWMAYHDVPESDVVAIADKLQPYCPGPDDAKRNREAIRRTYQKAADGIAVAGWSALTDHRAPLVSPGAAKRLDLLLRYRDPKLSFTRNTDDSEDDDDESDDEPDMPPQRYRIFPFNDIDALPDVEELVQGILQCESTAVLYGPGGSMKSFIALDLAFHIANGEDWCGCRVKQGQVLYIASEGAQGMKRRRKAWMLAHDLPTDGAWVMPDSLVLSDPETVDALIEQLKATGIRPVFIVMDTLSKNTIGSDENSTMEMAVAFAQADRLWEAFGSTVLIVHHTNKAGIFRGSSTIRNNVTTFIEVTREGEKDCDVEDVKLTVRCDKQKDLDEFPPMVFKPRRVVTRASTDLMPPETSLVLEMAGDVPAGRRKPLSPDTVYATLGRLGWSTQEDLMKELKVSESTIRRILKEMIEKQTVKKRERESGRIRWMVYATIEEADDAPDF